MPENSRVTVGTSSGYQIPFDIHRSGQGMYARGVTAFALGLIVLFGSMKVYYAFDNTRIGIITALAVFVVSLVGIMYVAYVNRKCVDFLIETESELRKVNWPVDKQATGFFEKYQELFNSAGVVIVCTIVLGIFIFAVDVIIEHIMRWTNVL